MNDHQPTPEQRVVGHLVAQRNQALDTLANVAAERDTLSAALDAANAEIGRLRMQLQQRAELNLMDAP